MLKKHFIAIFVLISLSAIAVLGSSPELIGRLFESMQNSLIAKSFSEKTDELSNNNKHLPENSKASQDAKIDFTDDSKSSSIPLQVTYLFLFKQLAAFEEKAKKSENENANGSNYRKLFQRRANLTDEQIDLLMKTAIACTAKVKIKDEAAKQVAARLRAQFPTNLPASQAPPPPPPSVELTALQKQRDEIIMQHREILKAGFGENFDRFEVFVHSRITSNVTSNITSETRSRAAFPRSARNSNTNPQSKIKEENK